MIYSLSEELRQAIIVEFLNKVNLYSIEAGNSDNDNQYPYSTVITPVFTLASISDYNISASSILVAVTDLSPNLAGTTNPTYNIGTSYTQSNWATGQYNGKVAYLSELSTDVYAQAGETKNLTITAPWTILTGTITFAIMGSLTWISFDDATSVMKLTAPTSSLSGFTNYTVYLSATVSSEIFTLKYNIKAYTCSIENCKACNYTNISVCTEWDTNYALSSDSSSCTSSSEESQIPKHKGLSAFNTAMIATSVSIGLITSLMSISSPQSIWSMINQYQLFLTLPLVGWYMSPELILFIQNFEFTAFTINFIPYEKLFVFEFLYNWLDIPQSNQNFEAMGIESGSVIINQLGVILMFIWLISMHLVYLLLKHKVLWKIESKILTKFFDKLDVIMIYNMYIRVIMEVFLFATLASFSESESFKYGSVAEIWSLIISLIFSILSVLIWAAVILHYIKFRNKTFDLMSNKFEELYADLRDKKITRLYTTWYLVRRAFMWLIIISSSFMPVLARAILFTLVQILSVIFMFSFPFSSLKDCIIELGNDIVLFVLTLIFTIWREEHYWQDDTLTDAVIYILTANGIFINFVIIVDLIFKFVKVRFTLSIF